MSYNPEDDEMTIYIAYFGNDERNIIALTIDKQLMKYFLKFHNCDKIKYKKYTSSIKNINKIINENAIHEISIHRIRTKDSDGNGIDLYVPLTDGEINSIIDNSWFFQAGSILYGDIGSYYNKLKQKYQDALNILFLDEIIGYIEPLFNAVNQHSFQNRQYKIERDMLVSLYMIEPKLFE